MNLFRNRIVNNIIIIRGKHDILLKDNIAEYFEAGNKYRTHPGVRKNIPKELPLKLLFAATSVINRYRSKSFRKNIKKINDEFLRILIDNSKIEKPYNSKFITTDDTFDYHEYEKVKQWIKFEANKRANYFEKNFYNKHDCASYMAARLPANYAAMSFVFNEIRTDEPDFVPKSVFDFGSGVGTTVWICDELWGNSIKEYSCVDINENMNDLSRELLHRGTRNIDNILDRVFYRQFLSAKHIPSYDLVVSAFSLLDMEDIRNRLYVVENLWQKTSGILVLLEHGSKAGFTAIMEARNFILRISNAQIEQSRLGIHSAEISNELAKIDGSVLAPCPHNFVCPRQSVLDKKSFCNFDITYQQLDYGQMTPGIKKEKFAFVILKKNGNFNWKEEQKNWLRVVQKTKKRSHHSICHVCDNDGSLKEIIASKSKCTKHVYNCIRKSKHGDKLPIQIMDRQES